MEIIKNIDIKNKKIISFSIWGNIRLYCIGAIKNALIAKIIFPEWICRFYYDSTVPNIIIDYLKKLDNVELVFIKEKSGGTIYKEGTYGSLWRFYPFNDNDVDIFMIRDIDSRLSKYEYIKINDFINSNYILHAFVDNNEVINNKYFRAGTTTFKNYINNNDTRIINNTKLDIFNLLKYIDKKNTNFYDDENFLNNIIYPLYKDYYTKCQRTHLDITIQNKYFPCNNNIYIYGKYVGNVVDEYDKLIDKNNNKDFNYKNNYDDLEELLNNYKNDLLNNNLFKYQFL